MLHARRWVLDIDVTVSFCVQVKRLLLLPNTFAGMSKTSGSSSSNNSTRSPQQQQQVGSPSGSLRPLLGTFSPATPTKQPVTPLNK
jgi:hypothetical protein